VKGSGGWGARSMAQRAPRKRAHRLHKRKELTSSLRSCMSSSTPVAVCVSRDMCTKSTGGCVVLALPSPAPALSGAVSLPGCRNPRYHGLGRAMTWLHTPVCSFVCVCVCARVCACVCVCMCCEERCDVVLGGSQA
jgi:hypothetical protein